MKFIQSQNGEVINIDNVIEISRAEGEGVNSKKKQATVYGIVAVDILGKDRELALYDDEKTADEVYSIFLEWLECSNGVMFVMPDELPNEAKED